MKYRPTADLPEAIERELDDVAVTLDAPTCQHIFLAQRNAAPAKYSDGMVVYADGTNWNPGSGEGIYCYYNAAWNYLG